MFSSWLLISLVNPEHQSEAEFTLKILLIGEEFLYQVAFVIKIILEFSALFIILISSFDAIKRLLRSSSRISRSIMITSVRLELARSLALSLEFLLAADIQGQQFLLTGMQWVN